MLSKIIDKVDKFVTPFNFVTRKLSIFLLFCMMMLTFSDVMARIFIHPIQGTHELTYLGLALIVFLSLGYTQQVKGHISVGVLIDLLPKRFQAIIDIVIYIFSIIIIGLLSWQIFAFGVRRINVITGDLGIPLYLFIFISGVGVAIYALTLTVDLLKSIQKVVQSN